METVMKKEEKTDVLSFPSSSLTDDDMISFTVQGQIPERTYEDRSVYFNIKSGSTVPEGSVSTNPEANITMWLQAEDAIDFGLKLIEHGKFALEANMIQHQGIHMHRQFQKFLDEDRVEEVCFELVDHSPANYGDGFHLFKITPTWIEGMAPQYQEDFCFEEVIYWSPFPQEYADQLDRYTRGCSYSFVGYDHDDEVERFNEQVRLMSGD